MTKCCDEYGCRRKKPILIAKTPFSDEWVALTDYTETKPGFYTAKQKHKVVFLTDPCTTEQAKEGEA